VRPKKARAAPVAPDTTPIKSLNDERYDLAADGNQPRDEFIDKLVFESMNAWGGCDDLAMEVKAFNAACRDLIASKRRRVG
jgi:hypothetical protein